MTFNEAVQVYEVPILALEAEKEHKKSNKENVKTRMKIKKDSVKVALKYKQFIHNSKFQIELLKIVTHL